MILAAIDIGSNAARLLINQVSIYKDGSIDFTKLNLIRVPLRLGLDVFSTGTISPGRSDMLMQTMQAFKLFIAIYKVEAVRCCATSAMRDASNGPALMEDVQRQTGLKIEIISGSEEANILYETHIAEKLSVNKSFLYIDVGGGSTEITLFAQNKIVFKESFNVGTLRLLQNQVSDAHWDAMKASVKTAVGTRANIEAIGTGGNINKVFSISKKKDGKPLSLELLKDYHKQLSSATVAERMHLFDMREDRADVIVPALQIFISIMRWSNAEEIYVPKIGLADGIIRMLYAERMGGKNSNS